MEIKEIIDSLEKGWPGFLALGYLLVKDSKIGEKIFSLFVVKHEKKQELEIKQQENDLENENKIQNLGLKYIERAMEENVRLGEKVANINEKLASIKTLSGAQLDAVRSLLNEIFVLKTKQDQLLEFVLKTKQDQLLEHAFSKKKGGNNV